MAEFSVSFTQFSSHWNVIFFVPFGVSSEICICSIHLLRKTGKNTTGEREALLCICRCFFNHMLRKKKGEGRWVEEEKTKVNIWSCSVFERGCFC